MGQKLLQMNTNNRYPQLRRHHELRTDYVQTLDYHLEVF